MIPDLILAIKDNILRKGNPLGLSSNEFCNWAKDLNIPKTGETILYTGCEYQLLPYTSSLIEIVKKIGPFGLKSNMFLSAAKTLEKIGLDAPKIFMSLTAKDKNFYDELLQKYARVLQKLGLDFGYLHEEEPYAGGLLYEFGLLEELSDYAQRVYEIFKRRGVKRIITISPHSLELLYKVYPLYVKNFNITVLHYTQVIKGALQRSDKNLNLAFSQETTVTIHDPCHLARSLNIIEEPRFILQAIKGIRIKEVEPTSKRFTGCCGAPLETLLPEITELVAQRRLEELQSTGAKLIITICPFCYFNFKKSLKSPGIVVKDLIEILDEAVR